MPTWTKGNQVFTVSTKGHDVPTGQTIVKIPITLTKSATSDQEAFMIFQPGILQGFNMYIGQNSSGVDLIVNFRHGVWDGDFSWSFSNQPIITIPAGFTGHKCMNPKAIAEALRNWGSRDQISIRLTRASDAGTVTNMTFASLLEITEEMMLDNDYPPNL